MFALVRIEAHQYLLARGLFAREILRQFVSSEIFCFGRFDIRKEITTNKETEYENYYYPVSVNWIIVLVPVSFTVFSATA